MKTETQQTAHTPGPWKLLPNHDGGRSSARVVLESNENHPIASVVQEVANPVVRLQDMANARLIAAAPELLAALELACTQLDPHSEAIRQARAAIAKAKGGAS